MRKPTPDVISTTDYYAFGGAMPGRTFSDPNYRYGMNGQEKDDEIFKAAMTAEFWEYDSRIGRRWNVDPIEYEWQSPYATFNNCPIYFSDPSGLEGDGNGNKNEHETVDQRGERLTAEANKKKGYTAYKWNSKRNRIEHIKDTDAGGATNHVGKIFLKIVGVMRKIFTSATSARGLIPQGGYQFGEVVISGRVARGCTGQKHNVRREINRKVRNDGGGNFDSPIVGIFGVMYNGDAYLDIEGDGEWHDEGGINGYAYAEGAGKDGKWGSLSLNTGLSGFSGSDDHNNMPNPIGALLVGSEKIPLMNFIDDAIGAAFNYIRAAELLNKNFSRRKHRHTTMIRVKNAKFTKHSVGYDLTIRYKFWRQKVNWFDKSERSWLWKKLHNVSKRNY